VLGFSILFVLFPPPRLFLYSSLVEHLQACISPNTRLIPLCCLSPPVGRFAWVAEGISLWRLVMGGRITFHLHLFFPFFLVDVDLFGWKCITPGI